jgi:hypothetical protein
LLVALLGHWLFALFLNVKGRERSK